MPTAAAAAYARDLENEAMTDCKIPMGALPPTALPPTVT
jgi:hypothetical protein